MKFLKTIVLNWIIPIGIGVTFASLSVKYFYFLAYVPTGSMLPTIQLDDVLYVNRRVDLESVERGDILVFRPNHAEYSEKNAQFVKRLIGMPGDKVEIKLDKNNKALMYINEELIEEDYVVYEDENPTTQEFIVPDDHYLFLGDNRDNSLDARYWQQAYIHKDQILGEAIFRIFPLSKIEKLE